CPMQGDDLRFRCRTPSDQFPAIERWSATWHGCEQRVEKETRRWRIRAVAIERSRQSGVHRTDGDRVCARTRHDDGKLGQGGEVTETMRFASAQGIELRGNAPKARSPSCWMKSELRRDGKQ